MTNEETRSEPAGSSRALTLATISFTVCFYAWALLGPLGPDLQEQLDLSDGQLALTVSIPVVLGSLMRIPLGVFAARYGGRAVVTALMAVTPLPLIGLGLFLGR
jgi:NNP family nitrate/nitrite transporter-like MFS transporter